MKALIVHIYSLILLICISAVAGHSSSHNSAARRSFGRRQDNPDPVQDPVVSPPASSSTVLFPPVSVEPPSEPTGEPSGEPSGESSAPPSASTEPSSTAEESVSLTRSSTAASESEVVTPPPSGSPSASASASESPDGGLSSILSSLLSSILGPDPSPSSDDVSSIPTNPPSSTVDTDTSTPTPPPSSSTDDGEITLIPSSIQITLPSSTIEVTVVPSSTEEPSSEPSGPSTSEPPTGPSTSEPPTGPSTSEPPTGPSTSEPPTGPSTSEPPTGPSTSEPPTGPSTSEPPTGPSTSEPPTGPSTSEPPGPSTSESISFPQGPSTSESIITSDPASSTTVISIPSDLSFILTESSLAIDTFSTATPTPTLTDPDQVTSTVESTISFTASSVPAAILPDDLPRRIYPNDGAKEKNKDKSKVLISIAFDGSINWPHVVSNSVIAGQIFAFMPIIIGTCTGVTAAEVENFALQVNIPANYHGPENQSLLQTLYLSYVDPSIVDTLAAQIKSTSSAFYNGVQDPIAKQLASHVISGFNVQSVADPNNEGSGSSQSNSGAASNDGKQRQDAIIGVVSALGAVAVLVLVFLVYRSLKRRRELAHRRLSDPPDAYIVGARPEGREFDQDSVGGQRRRSFYFAEDSLRESPQQHHEYYEVARNSPSPGMRERRVIPNAISAPVLQESSMNW